MTEESVGVFYLWLNSGEGRQPIQVGSKTVYIRAEVDTSGSLEDALDRASPAEDECVMNTHFILSDEEWEE